MPQSSSIKFSTYLMTTVIVLTTLSVLVILGALHFYFHKRVESEFYKKLLAQKGQVEIILKNRLSGIKRMLDNIGADNIIRVTVMLGARSQLEERIIKSYPPKNGVYHFVKKETEASIIPEQYPGIPKELIDFAIGNDPKGEILEEGDKTRLVWWFSTHITHGNLYTLYDMAQDRSLMENIHQTVVGDISVFKGDRIFILTSGTTLPFDTEMQDDIAIQPEFHHLGQNVVLSKIRGFPKLYFQSSLESLSSEKRKVTLWMGVFSILVLAVSTIMSVFLAKKMVDPLGEMTKKAIQISEGHKDLMFETRRRNYWEFNQLSQTFNYMLTNLKEAEEQSRYKELLENVDDAVYILDQKGHILEANEAAYSQLGYTREEFFELNLAAVVPEEDARSIIERLGENPQGQNPNKITVETFHKTIDGHRIPVEIQSRAIIYKGENVVLNVARDISQRIEAEQEKKQLEAQLIHAQKMEAVGTLAGGVAHDFNNMLMGIQAHASMMRLKIDPSHPFDKYIHGIENNIRSAANLIKQLLGFARKGKYEPKTTCLNDILEKSSDMFIRTRKEIKAYKKLQGDLWNVKADSVQIEQVLINLYLNAWQAMPNGGELYIQTENVFLSDDYCKPFEVPGGNYVKTSVTDTGIGMDSATMERIFEPFFTTKEIGKGTGLGLASVYGIIKNHHGFIRVYSKEDHGATFNFYLPASDAETSRDPMVNHDLVKGKETILLVDDEETPIHAEELMLKELGYKVLTARSGREAISLYEKNMEDLDLVALDMIMPEMNGRDTYEQLKEMKPDVKVLLLSGYSLNKQIEELLELGCKGFIQKPFDIIQLSQKVREVLDS